MAAGDVSALMDIAAPVTETPTETPVETPAEEVTESPTELDEPAAEPETETPGDKPVDGRTNPAAIRSALKNFRDSDPKNAPIARELNNAYGRYTAYKAEFPTVAAARESKALLEAVGGAEGLSQLQSTIKSVNETDNALYAGDRSVLRSLYEDMKSNGHPEAFAKLAGPYLEDLREVDQKAYYETMKPHFYQGMVEVGLPKVLGALAKSLSGEKPDLDTAKALLQEMTDWFGNLENSVKSSDKDKLDPERQAFEKERTEFQTTKQKEFQTGIATACEGDNNRELGTELGKYFKNYKTFFNQLSLEGKQDLARGIKSRLFSELEADKSYQSQMDAFFAVKNPDKNKIQQYHASKVKTMAARIVKSMIETRYPNYLKGGAKPTPKPGAPKPGAPAPAGVKPQYTSSKPDRNEIDWQKTSDTEFIAGRAYLRNGRYVSWGNKPR